MASEVIELGSSDDDAEPIPKEIKPPPNAMVHIPTALHGVTIKPAKRNSTSCNGLMGKKVGIIKKTNLPFNQNLHKVKTPVKHKMSIKQAPNPLSKPFFIGNSTFANTSFRRIVNAQTITSKKPSNLSKNMMKIEGAGCLSNLPPTITVKRTKTTSKHNVPGSVINMKKKIKVNKEVLTVDLDLVDDNVPTSSRPQWYIRPEEQAKSPALEEQNNVEPDKSKFIEITIEDSPVKPSELKKKTDLAITIEDSPNKPECHKRCLSEGSDEENSTSEKSPQSKKRLVYPRKENENDTPKLVEVHLNPLQNNENGTDNLYVNLQEKNIDPIIVEIEESPFKNEEPLQNSTPKKKSPVKPIFNNSELIMPIEKKNNCSEFNPVYQSFIDLCFELENSDDMKIIVEKKIKSYYRQVPKEYTESEDFIDMVSSKILAMKAGPEKMYLYIKDIVDELNFKRKSMKSQTVPEESKDKESNNHLYGADSEFDSKRQRQIRRLEKTLKKLHRAIQKLEEQEVDFDDEEDSVYLLTERYKERLVRVHAKFCQLTNTKMPSEPRVQMDARPGQPKGPAKRLEKWINKKVPMGKPLPFPDFHDVLNCVREANEEDNLGWNEADIMEEARDLFTRCGKKLQRRRQENEWRIAASRICFDADPAEKDEELRVQLHKNSQVAAQKETELFKKYADRQKQLKLEAEEIGDKEAEESPIESDDEDVNDDVSSLETAEQRKERLKRLIHEKSKKSNEENKCEVTLSLESNDSPHPSTHLESKEENNDLQMNSNIDDQKEVEDNEDSTDINKDNSNPNDVIASEIIEGENNSSKLEHQEKMSVCGDNAQSSPIDDDNKIESDIDELHLLQKLHSESEMNTSTIESTDTDTPIAISDTLDSGSDDKKTFHDDVISIENSSYSEAEVSIENSTESKAIGDHTQTANDAEIYTNIEDTEMQIEKTINKSNNDEYNDSVENILLASSEDDEDGSNEDSTIRRDLGENLENDNILKGTNAVHDSNDAKVEGNPLGVGIAEEKDKINFVITESVDNLLKNNGLDSDSGQLKRTGEEHIEIIKEINKHISNVENGEHV